MHGAFEFYEAMESEEKAGALPFMQDVDPFQVSLVFSTKRVPSYPTDEVLSSHAKWPPSIALVTPKSITNVRMYNAKQQKITFPTIARIWRTIG